MGNPRAKRSRKASAGDPAAGRRGARLSWVQNSDATRALETGNPATRSVVLPYLIVDTFARTTCHFPAHYATRTPPTRGRVRFVDCVSVALS